MLAEDKQLECFYDDDSYGSLRADCPKVEISSARLAEYRHVRGLIGLEKWMVTSEQVQGSHLVRLLVGFYTADDCLISKHITYSDTPLAPLKSNLDAESNEHPASGERWYKRIKGNWYLDIQNLGKNED